MENLVLNLGKVLSKAELLLINGGAPPCYEFCADPTLDQYFVRPQGCTCSSSGGGGGGNTGGDDGNGPVDPV